MHPIHNVGYAIHHAITPVTTHVITNAIARVITRVITHTKTSLGDAPLGYGRTRLRVTSQRGLPPGTGPKGCTWFQQHRALPTEAARTAEGNAVLRGGQHCAMAATSATRSTPPTSTTPTDATHPAWHPCRIGCSMRPYRTGACISSPGNRVIYAHGIQHVLHGRAIATSCCEWNHRRLVAATAILGLLACMHGKHVVQVRRQPRDDLP